MIAGKLWRAQRQGVEKIHQWRPRRSRVGELVQWDTSEHAWLEERGPKLYLIGMIDDASSRVHARFVLHDSSEENMRLLWSYVERYGRPVSYYTDKASLFQTAPKIARDSKELPRDEREPLPPTQIGRALGELDRGAVAASQGLRFILHLLRTVEDILGKTPPLGEPDALGLARRIGSRILIQPIVPIIHRIAAKQAVVPPGDHAFGADLQSFRHFFECQ